MEHRSSAIAFNTSLKFAKSSLEFRTSATQGFFIGADAEAMLTLTLSLLSTTSYFLIILNKMTHILGTTIIAIRWLFMVYVGYHDENMGVPACRQEQ